MNTIYDCDNHNNNNLQTEKTVVVKYGSLNVSDSSVPSTTTTLIDKSTTTTTQHQQTNNIGILVTAFLAALASGGPTYAFGLYGR